MKNLAFLILLCCSGMAHAAPKAKLWASISVNKAVFQEELTREAKITFTLVNDGAQAAKVNWSASRVFLNKRDVNAWSDLTDRELLSNSHYANLPGEIHVPALSLNPGQRLEVTVDLSRQFERPGNYVLDWQGADFKAAPVAFRVLPWTENVTDEILLVRLIRNKLPAKWRVYFEPDEKQVTVEHDPVRNPKAFKPKTPASHRYS